MLHALFFAYLIYLAYLLAGWAVLRWGLGYTPVSVRRELALNGVGDSPGDTVFQTLVSMVYLFVVHIWPVAVHRKVTTGRVIGKDMRDGK